MVEIIPAILPEDFSDLEEKISLVSAHVPILHVDVTNGTLTPKSNWPYGGDQTDFLKIVNEVEGFPFWEEVSFEAHLMVNNPADDSEVSRVLAILKNRFDKNSSHLGIEVGLGVNMETSMDKIYPHVLEADFIHLMSIKNIGVQGNPFNEQIFDRIRDLKEKYPETIVSVDGGVNLENAPHLIEAGANRLVVGSAIYSAPEPEEALFDLQELSL
jgi:ribulose-phosphate 3-epimerase